MIKKLLAWLRLLPGHPKKEEINAWPFPVVLGTPPSCAEKKAVKKRGRPALKKATTRVAVKKTAAKKTAKKKVK